jgi:hypothetical protein
MKKDHTARRADTYTLKEAISELLNAYKLRGKYNETYLVASWSRIMGAAIANRTGRIYINNRKLFVQITSAPLKNELAMSKSKIVEILNREAREDVLEDVIFI